MQLIDVKDIAQRTGLSERSVWRMRDSGALPLPVRLGRLVKWREPDVERWLAAGCPHCRRTGWRPEGAGMGARR